MKICCSLNYEKLSAEARTHLSQNTRFYLNSEVKALISQQCKLKNLLHSTSIITSLRDSPCSSSDVGKRGKKDKSSEQIVLYAGKYDLSDDSEKIQAHLQGMQWRVLELEKLCTKMQNQLAKIMKSRVSGNRYARSLPKLCS